MKVKGIVGLVLAAALVIGLLVWALAPVGGRKAARKPHARETARSEAAAVATNVEETVELAPTSGVRKAVKGKKRLSRKELLQQRAKKMRERKAARNLPDPLSPEDRKVVDHLRDTMDGDDPDLMRKEAAELLSHATVDVRLEAVDALGFVGEKALVDLSRAMGDSNTEVTEAARGQVENILMGMDDQTQVFRTAAMFLEACGKDKEGSTMLLGILDSAGTQIIDPDDADSVADVEKARGNRAAIVETFAGLIEKKGPLAEAAKETYESISGEEWTGREAADKWAADIEDPKPSEPEEGDSAEPEEQEEQAEESAENP